MERRRSAQPPLTHAPKLEIEEGKAYLVDDKEQLPYELLRNLGHGHSGNVEEVRDINTGRVFARKTIRIPRGRSGKDRKKIFENEVEIIRSLAGHHHVIRVFATYVSKFEVGQILHPVADEGDLERFLESCSHSIIDCESLHINDIDKARVNVLKRSFGCLVSGLEFMHQRKIRHKDVKPRNVLVHRGSVIYTDFGYSLDSSREGHSTTAGRPDFLTRRYSAPEVVDYEPRNSRSDVFSLGCVFLEVLSTLAKELVLESYHYYDESMSSIHTQLIGANIPTSLEFLVGIIISMTLANPTERSTAAEVASKFHGYPDFLCGRCQPPNSVQLPLRQRRNTIEPGNSRTIGQNEVFEWNIKPKKHRDPSLIGISEVFFESTTWSSRRILPKDSLENVRNRRLFAQRDPWRAEELRREQEKEEAASVRREEEKQIFRREWQRSQREAGRPDREQPKYPQVIPLPPHTPLSQLLQSPVPPPTRTAEQLQQVDIPPPPPLLTGPPRQPQQAKLQPTYPGAILPPPPMSQQVPRMPGTYPRTIDPRILEVKKARRRRYFPDSDSENFSDISVEGGFENVEHSRGWSRDRNDRRRSRSQARDQPREAHKEALKQNREQALERATLASSSESDIRKEVPQLRDAGRRHTDAATRRRTSASERHRESSSIKSNSFWDGLPLIGRSKTMPVVSPSKSAKLVVVKHRKDRGEADPTSLIEDLQKGKEKPSSIRNSSGGSRKRSDHAHRSRQHPHSNQHSLKTVGEEAEDRGRREERRRADRAARERQHYLSGGQDVLYYDSPYLPRPPGQPNLLWKDVSPQPALPPPPVQLTLMSKEMAPQPTGSAEY